MANLPPSTCHIYLAKDSPCRTEATLLASFTYSVSGQRFRFVVARISATNAIAIAHKHSGRVVAYVGPVTLEKWHGNYYKAGPHALEKACVVQGEIRIYQYLMEQLL